MQQLRFEPTHVTVTNVNLRRELHGDDKKLAVDLNIRAEVAPAIIDSLIFGQHEKIEKLLYSGTDLRKAAGLSTIKFDTVFDKHMIMLNWAVDDDKAMKFKEVKIGKFVAEPKEGGMVELAFQINIQPSPEQYIFLCKGYEYEHWDLECIGAAQGDLLESDKGAEEEQDDGQEEESDTGEQVDIESAADTEPDAVEETEEETNVVGHIYPVTENSQKPQ